MQNKKRNRLALIATCVFWIFILSVVFSLAHASFYDRLKLRAEAHTQESNTEKQETAEKNKSLVSDKKVKGIQAETKGKLLETAVEVESTKAQSANANQ